MEHDVSYARNAQSQAPPPTSSSSEKPHAPRAVSESATPSQSASKPKAESSDNLKSFKVSLDDPTWKVLPAALKKYRINNDNWQNYAMFICYGSTGALNSLILSRIILPMIF
jgi:hypothetical protein